MVPTETQNPNWAFAGLTDGQWQTIMSPEFMRALNRLHERIEAGDKITLQEFADGWHIPVAIVIFDYQMRRARCGEVVAPEGMPSPVPLERLHEIAALANAEPEGHA